MDGFDQGPQHMPQVSCVCVLDECTKVINAHFAESTHGRKVLFGLGSAGKHWRGRHNFLDGMG